MDINLENFRKKALISCLAEFFLSLILMVVFIFICNETLDQKFSDLGLTLFISALVCISYLIMWKFAIIVKGKAIETENYFILKNKIYQKLPF